MVALEDRKIEKEKNIIKKVVRVKTADLIYLDRNAFTVESKEYPRLIHSFIKFRAMLIYLMDAKGIRYSYYYYSYSIFYLYGQYMYLNVYMYDSKNINFSKGRYFLRTVFFGSIKKGFFKKKRLFKNFFLKKNKTALQFFGFLRHLRQRFNIPKKNIYHRFQNYNIWNGLHNKLKLLMLLNTRFMVQDELKSLKKVKNKWMIKFIEKRYKYYPYFYFQDRMTIHGDRPYDMSAKKWFRMVHGVYIRRRSYRYHLNFFLMKNLILHFRKLYGSWVFMKQFVQASTNVRPIFYFVSFILNYLKGLNGKTSDYFVNFLANIKNNFKNVLIKHERIRDKFLRRKRRSIKHMFIYIYKFQNFMKWFINFRLNIKKDKKNNNIVSYLQNKDGLISFMDHFKSLYYAYKRTVKKKDTTLSGLINVSKVFDIEENEFFSNVKIRSNYYNTIYQLNRARRFDFEMLRKQRRFKLKFFRYFKQLALMAKNLLKWKKNSNSRFEILYYNGEARFNTLQKYLISLKQILNFDSYKKIISYLLNSNLYSMRYIKFIDIAKISMFNAKYKLLPRLKYIKLEGSLKYLSNYNKKQINYYKRLVVKKYLDVFEGLGIYDWLLPVNIEEDIVANDYKKKNINLIQKVMPVEFFYEEDYLKGSKESEVDAKAFKAYFKYVLGFNYRLNIYLKTSRSIVFRRRFPWVNRWGKHLMCSKKYTIDFMPRTKEVMPKNRLKEWSHFWNVGKWNMPVENFVKYFDVGTYYKHKIDWRLKDIYQNFFLRQLKVIKKLYISNELNNSLFFRYLDYNYSICNTSTVFDKWVYDKIVRLNYNKFEEKDDDIVNKFFWRREVLDIWNLRSKPSNVYKKAVKYNMLYNNIYNKTNKVNKKFISKKKIKSVIKDYFKLKKILIGTTLENKFDSEVFNNLEKNYRKKAFNYYIYNIRTKKKNNFFFSLFSHQIEVGAFYNSFIKNLDKKQILKLITGIKQNQVVNLNSIFFFSYRLLKLRVKLKLLKKNNIIEKFDIYNKKYYMVQRNEFFTNWFLINDMTINKKEINTLILPTYKEYVSFVSILKNTLKYRLLKYLNITDKFITLVKVEKYIEEKIISSLVEYYLSQVMKFIYWLGWLNPESNEKLDIAYVLFFFNRFLKKKTFNEILFIFFQKFKSNSEHLITFLKKRFNIITEIEQYYKLANFLSGYTFKIDNIEFKNFYFYYYRALVNTMLYVKTAKWKNSLNYLWDKHKSLIVKGTDLIHLTLVNWKTYAYIRIGRARKLYKNRFKRVLKFPVYFFYIYFLRMFKYLFNIKGKQLFKKNYITQMIMFYVNNYLSKGIFIGLKNYLNRIFYTITGYKLIVNYYIHNNDTSSSNFIAKLFSKMLIKGTSYINLVKPLKLDFKIRRQNRVLSTINNVFQNFSQFKNIRSLYKYVLYQRINILYSVYKKYNFIIYYLVFFNFKFLNFVNFTIYNKIQMIFYKNILNKFIIFRRVNKINKCLSRENLSKNILLKNTKNYVLNIWNLRNEKNFVNLKNINVQNNITYPKRTKVFAYFLDKFKYYNQWMKGSFIFGYKFQFVGRFRTKLRASSVWYKEGNLGSSLVGAKVDYGFFMHTGWFGSCNAKIWLYKTDIMPTYIRKV